MFADKLKTRCGVLLRQRGEPDRRKAELRMPCRLQIEIAASPAIKTEIFEISLAGMLIGGAAAEKIPLNKVLKLRWKISAHAAFASQNTAPAACRPNSSRPMPH